MATNEEILIRLELLEHAYKTHLGPQPGATSLNTPHTGVPYLDSNGDIALSVIPTGTSSATVALGDHTHISGFYL